MTLLPRALLCLPMLAASLLAERIPFTLPWDDTSDNATNFSSTLHAPVGRWGRVAVSDDGHYAIADERVRFFGVNIVAGACYPPQAKAEAIAQRLARFGFNVVRFHHMESTWAESLIDYGAGGSRTFDAANLDRFDKLVAELKAAGVYTNLNLLTSRRFSAADGLDSSIDEVDWKIQHILAYWDDDLLALQKEHATQLLGHTNAYTGLTYAEDPAVAFVEINNENGLMHQWFAGEFDGLPEHYRASLGARWNAWLQDRYADHGTLLAAWGAVVEPEGVNVLGNPSFASGTTGWHFEQNGTAAGTLSTGTFAGRQGARIQITATSDAAWHIQLNQSGLAVTKDQLYTIRFWARASAPMYLGIALGQAHTPWQTIGINRYVPIDTQWRQVEVTGFATQTDSNARVNFGGMGQFLGSVDLDDVELRAGGSSGGLGAGLTLEAGNLPVPLRTDTLSPGQKSDWMEFLRALEFAYWAEMKRFVVEEVGYRGILWGTTIMNSTPNVQALFDAVDTHAYWQHPQFPNEAWSATDWTVGTSSMVNDAYAGTFAGLARQAIDGYPHNVTEYQHCAPNTYSAEAGLFLAFYGSLQDWDGLYFFQYGSGPDDWDRGYFNSFLDLDQHSPKLVNAAIGALLFRQFAIAPAEEQITMRFTPQRELELLAERGSQWNVVNLSHLDLSPRHALVHRVRMSVGEDATGLDTRPPDPVELAAASDTGELVWDRTQGNAGVVTLDAPTAKSVMGYDAGRSFDFGELTFDPGTTEQGWCTFAAVLREGRFDTLAQYGGRGLFATTGNVENSGMVWTDLTHNSVGNQWGAAPVLTENVPAVVTLPGVPPELVRVWSLDVRGDRAVELIVTSDGANGARIVLGGAAGSLWYEWAVEPVSVPPAPTGVSLLTRRSDRLRLGWQKASAVAPVRVDYSVEGQPWSESTGLLADGPASGQVTFTLPDLPEASLVDLRVISTNAAGDGSPATLAAYTAISYEAWAAAHFSAGQLADPTLSGRSRDPDADGLTNELECVFDRLPLDADPLTLPGPELHPGVARWSLPIHWLRATSPSLRLEATPDLRHWQSFEGAPALFPGDYRDVTLSLDGNAAVFWRWSAVSD